MKRGIQLFALAAAVMLLAGLVAPDAGATCPALKQFSSGDRSFNYNYLYSTGTASLGASGCGAACGNGSARIGQWWDPNSATNNGDGGNSDLWIRQFNSYPFYIDGNLTDPGVAPGTSCPGAEMVIVVEDAENDGSEAYFAVIRAPEDAAAAIQYDLSPTNGNLTWGNFQMQPIPRPKVVSSTRLGDQSIDLELQWDGITAFYDGGAGLDPTQTVVAFRLVQVANTAVAEPGRDAGSWAATGVSSAVDAVGTTPFNAAGCGGENQTFIATQLEFANGRTSSLVSAPTAVECDPNLADPKFKLIDKPRQGKGRKAK